VADKPNHLTNTYCFSFYSGHCKKLTPEYEGAAAVLSAQDPPRTIAKVDATEAKAIAERFEIKGFPTLFFWNNGTKMEYSGGRTKDTIIDWINKKTGPASTEVDCEAMKAKTADAKLALSYFGALEGDVFENFMKGAKNPAIGEKYSFFHTADAACAESFGVVAPGISLSRGFDESPLAVAGSSEDEIVAFAKKSSVPRLITFSEDYIEPIFGEQQPAMVLFTEEDSSSYQTAFAEAAKENQGEILFVTSGVSEGIQSRLGEFIGVEKGDLPQLRIIKPAESMMKFNYEGDVANLTGADVNKFLADFKADKLQPHLKSEAIPEPMTNEGLTVLVGKSFDDVVKDATKDVLVKYYAPWCGHCKTLAPIWDELAADVMDIDDLVIAKFDSTANEVAGLEIKGFPTLKFYPKDNKAGVDYSGDRDLPAFKSFLAENSSAYKSARAATEETKEAASEEL